MAYVLKEKLANPKNHGGKRAASDIKYIVIHYTGNDGDTDEANGKYFANNVVKASAHYFVDDDSVTQSVRDNYIAWSVGGSKYSNCATTGGGKYYGKCTNTNSISIELCDDVKNGTVYPSEKTIENAIALTKTLMKKYNIPASNVIRHFDVVGKSCPAYWCGTTKRNADWETEFHNKLQDKVQEKPKGETTVKIELNVLKKGSKGEQVKTLQRLLIAMEYSCGSAGADGDFGNGTDAAVRKYQKNKKLTVDGIVGQTTWDSILK